jgi:CRISPR-associated endonuclease Csn1
MNTTGPGSANRQDTIWSFDLGKASIGEAVRVEGAGTFLHKASLLIPAEFAARGPAWKSGTPASRHRMWRTRTAHDHRVAWLDELWKAAGLVPLKRRAVKPETEQWTTFQRTVRGKQKLKTRAAKTDWQLAQKGDPRLEREFAGENEPLHTSCLLRIALLRGGEGLKEWQIYKALWSAIQKRGYSDVPWKEQRKGKDDAPNETEAAENARAGQRWEEFLAALQAAGLDETYHRPCYFDAFHMKLWNPADAEKIHARSTERPQSTQKVSFPGGVVEAEIHALASNASARLGKLAEGFRKWMDDYSTRVLTRVREINAHRAEKGKKPMRVPDFAGAAKDFAELFVYGPGGKPTLPNNLRPIASYDPAKRKTAGLRPGTPGDWQAALGQRVARFDNRLQRNCALIPRLNCCRNTTDEDLKNAKDGDPRLLPAEVTFLMKIKNMRVQELDAKRTQRGLNPNEFVKLFKERSKKREYTFTKKQWREWCAANGLRPVVDADDKKKPGAKKQEDSAGEEKKKTDYAVERASSEGRSRFSRPALRLLKELLLSGKSPSEFHAALLKGDADLLKMLGPDAKRPLELFADSGDAKADAANAIKGLLHSDLAFLLRMRKPDVKEDSWDGIYIPTQNLDHVMHETGADAAARNRAIRELIGMQNNPIVRHRLDTFWERLKTLEKLKGPDGQPIGAPGKVVIELVRDDPESSWLGKDAKKEMTDAMKAQRDKRDAAKERLKEMDHPHGDVLKFMLWEAQGGHCLYGESSSGGDAKAVKTALPFTGMSKYRVDHIVPRAMGGPDAWYNLILTEDTTNAIKGDRTPWQWFHADRSTAEWDAYRERVMLRAKELGGRKVRLLLSADAHKLVEHYKPLAETAWIARLARVIVNLHFGWANVSDAAGNQRVLLASGGLTARIRRRYHLDSLLGNDRALD